MDGFLFVLLIDFEQDNRMGGQAVEDPGKLVSSFSPLGTHCLPFP